MKIFLTLMILASPLLGNTLPSEQRKTNKMMQAALSPVQKYLQDCSAVFYDNKKRTRFIYGTVMSADGLIFTKASELDKMEDFHIRVGSTRYKEPKILKVNEQWDLALVKVDAEGLIPVDLESDSEIATGTWTVSNGASTTRVRRPRPGIISANKREIKAGEPGVLGITFKLVDEKITILGVAEESGAEEAGIEKDDLIIGLNGVELSDDKEFIKLLKEKSAGDVVSLKIQRGEEILELDAELKPRPMSRNDQMSGMISKRRTGFPMVLQHETMLSQTSVGGPLFTLDGKFLGMNIAAANRVETFAIPVENLSSVFSEMKAAAGN